MLIGKYLCWYHQCTLKSVFRRKHHGQKRNYCFTTSNISLNKSGHDILTFHVFLHIIPYPQLRSRQFIRQLSQEFADLRLIFKMESVLHPVMCIFNLAQRKNKNKKFLKNESLSCRKKCFFILREMHLPHRLFIRPEMIFLRKFIRKKVILFPHLF